MCMAREWDIYRIMCSITAPPSGELMAQPFGRGIRGRKRRGLSTPIHHDIDVHDVGYLCTCYTYVFVQLECASYAYACKNSNGGLVFLYLRACACYFKLLQQKYHGYAI